MEGCVPAPSCSGMRKGKELVGMRATPDDTFRELVQQLMNAGWYRTGHGEGPPGADWRFEQGHTLETSTGNVRWIGAPNEREAMRILWDEVRHERVGVQP